MGPPETLPNGGPESAEGTSNGKRRRKGEARRLVNNGQRDVRDRCEIGEIGMMVYTKKITTT